MVSGADCGIVNEYVQATEPVTCLVATHVARPDCARHFVSRGPYPALYALAGLFSCRVILGKKRECGIRI